MIRAITMILLCIVGIGGVFQCSMLPSIAGNSSSETTNGYIVGSLMKNDGSYVMNARVMLVPDNFNPVKDGTVPDSLTDTTDEAGMFIFRVPSKGIYNEEALDPATGDRTLISGISVFGHDTVFAPTAMLQRPGAIKALLPSQAAATAAAAYVYLPGTTRFGRVAGSIAIIDSVPAGSFAALWYVNQSDTTQNQNIKTNFTVTSACTTFITADHAWNFSRNLYINTTLSGAAVSGAVTNFPLLIRLNSANFPFGQAKSDGGDLRFTKSNGAQLSYEIERWDPVAQQAEIWVKVDTVYGNDSTHYFTMLWGDSSSTGSSNSAAVFDTAAGFIGVWHLGGSGNANAGDATLHHYDGTPTDTPPQAIPGIIGTALQFDGNANGLVMKNTAHTPLNFSRPGSYTFSAWVYVDTIYVADEFIAGKGYDQYSLRVKGSTSYPSNLFSIDEYVDAPVYGTEMRLAPVVTRQWKYIVGIRDTANSYLFIDGTCVDSSGSIFYSKGDVQDSTNFSIGRCAAPYAAPANSNNYLAFKGKIDEVRIANVACTADWVKLSYMNQKQQDALVKW